MKIFIWKSYGEIDVYAAETVEQLTSILDTVISCLDGWDLDDHITKVREFIARNDKPDNPRGPADYRKAINYLLDKACIGSHETFEHGTGFDQLK